MRPLHADHEEADTRLLLHGKHAVKDERRVVIQSPVTDVLVLCVSHYEEIGCQEVRFRTGFKDRLKYIRCTTWLQDSRDSFVKQFLLSTPIDWMRLY